jgi:hypothetical protein
VSPGIERDQLGVLGDAGIAGRGVEPAAAQQQRDCASFHASACSRPPDPSSRMFMPAPIPIDDDDDAGLVAKGSARRQRRRR